MKCPRCWTEKAYLRTVSGWKGVLLACLLLRPMRCHHCYHKFLAPWILTVGKQIHPPALRIAPISRGASCRCLARGHASARPKRGAPIEPSIAEDHPERDAA